jgi:hypothetical protein
MLSMLDAACWCGILTHRGCSIRSFVSQSQAGSGFNPQAQLLTSWGRTSPIPDVMHVDRSQMVYEKTQSTAFISEFCTIEYFDHESGIDGRLRDEDDCDARAAMNSSPRTRRAYGHQGTAPYQLRASAGACRRRHLGRHPQAAGVQLVRRRTLPHWSAASHESSLHARSLRLLDVLPFQREPVSAL